MDINTIPQVEKLLSVSSPKTHLDLITYSNEVSPEISSLPYGNEETCISEFFIFRLMWPRTPYHGTHLAGKHQSFKKKIHIARDARGYLICLNFNTPSVAIEIFDPNSRKPNSLLTIKFRKAYRKERAKDFE